MIRLWIEGQPPRKSNSRRVVRIHGGKKSDKGIRVIKSDNALQWVDAAIMLCPPSLRYLGMGDAKHPLEIWFTVYYSSKRPDLSIELILDALQEMGVISDDRHVYEYHARKQFDKHLQGVMVEIEQMDYRPHFNPRDDGLMWVIGGTGQTIHVAHRADRLARPLCGSDAATHWQECHRVKGQPTCEDCLVEIGT